jgi:hypothetical protein
VYSDLQVFNALLTHGDQVVQRLDFQDVEELVLMLVWLEVVIDLVQLIKIVDGSERHQRT